MVVSVFLYPVLYGLELFLASALITQIAVSLAAVVVSTVTIYYCRQQLVHWHQERVIRRRGRWQSDVSIKSSKKHRHPDNSESSEGELSDPSLLRRLRAGLRSRSHEHIRTRASREAGEARSLKSPQVASEDAKKETQDLGRVRPKLTKQVGAMHRSHWVAKPQQSLPTILRRSSESDAELRGGKASVGGPERQSQEEPSIYVAAEVMVGQTGDKTLKRSRATARMTFKKHPRFSSSDSSSSVSPASSSAESDDLVGLHGETGNRADFHTDITVTTRRVPSIQVEPIVEERIIPIGRHGPPHSPPSNLEESTRKEISRLEFSLAVVEAHSYLHQHQQPQAETHTRATCQEPVDAPPSYGTSDQQTYQDKRDNSNVSSISTSGISINDRLTGEDSHVPSNEQEDSQQVPRDSLDVSPVIAGEEAYPEAAAVCSDDNTSAFIWVSEIAVESSQRPLILEPKLISDGVSETGEEVNTEVSPLLAEDESGLLPCQTARLLLLPPKDEVKMDEVKRMDSLDVPPTITGESCFPQLMLTVTKRQTVDEDQNSNGHNVPSRKIVKIRPKSLDIPPILPAPYTRSAESAPPSPPSGAGHGVKRKHSNAKSILKRSGSMERPGRKKSVSFSPEVSPREFEVERCYHGDIDRDRRDSPKRPRVLRHFSMDIPDARVAFEDDMSLSVPQPPWSHGDSDDDSNPPDVFSPAALDTDKLSRAEGWVHPSPLEPMQIEGSDARMAFVPISALESDDSGRKSAKERFLEAGGAKAVLSVLCTQDSSDSNGSKPASEAGADAPVNDGSEEDSMETMPDIDQPLSIPAEVEEDASNNDSAPVGGELTSQEAEKASRDQADGKGIKSRFLEYKEDSADIHTSRLFVQTVRSSVESDSSDEQDRSPGPQQDTTRVDGKGKAVCCEDDEDHTTSAKSRFLQSCQDVDRDGEIPNCSRFVVSVVRSYTTGCHRQDSPTLDPGGSKETDTKNARHREVPGGNNANTWRNLLEQELSEDIEFYESQPKPSGDGKPESVSSPSGSLVHGQMGPLGFRKSETEATETGAQTRYQSGSYTASSQHSPTYSQNAVIVLDNGSEMLKVGFSGDVQPRFTLPSVVGRHPCGVAPGKRSTYIGYEATRRTSLLSLDYPSSEGVVQNWEDLEQIWAYVLTSLLNVAPQEHPLLLSEYASTAKEQRGKCMEMLFEKFQVPSLCFVNQGALALHAQGDTSGMVLSSGGGLTEVVPVLDGCTIHCAVTTLKVAGRQVTRCLGNLLESKSGYAKTSTNNMEVLRDIKETMAYVCMDYEREVERVSKLEPLEYKLPDGSSLALGHAELFKCTEQLFKPECGGLKRQSGIHDMIQETLKRCDPTVLTGIRKSLLLAGGNTQLRGFGDRLQLELASAHLPWSVSMPQERTDSVWLGGSVVATHGDFARRCVTAKEYAEHGQAAVHPKCF